MASQSIETGFISQEVVEVAGIGLGIIPLFPLLGSVLTYLLFRKNGKSDAAGWLASAAALGSFISTVFYFQQLSGVPLQTTLWKWISVNELQVDLSLMMDNLSAVMTLVVTGVGTLIHVYAIGYMHDDPNKHRFFSYLNLFLFAMLLLVLGSNLLVMFVGWEGVGLCSYLLIGFWYKEMGNAKAGQKAFVVNRIGDAGFLLGMFILFWTTERLDYAGLFQSVGLISPELATIACLLLFIGAMGKSAQIPLFVWLPDAMAGPTPVSALIHAATMVTAGVYMITRLSFLFIMSPLAMAIICVFGTLTAFVAATIALTQSDIKKVLAYSTVSQLGYMFMALGAGAFSNGIYHVVTHAFFKALLFMGAGSVIVGCHHVQDMRQFGGLRKVMPKTFITYAVGTIAIAGLFPFSGFFSKDQILWTVFSDTSYVGAYDLFGVGLNKVLYVFGFLTAILTALYMTRSLVLTFFGDYRGSEHPHETSWVMTVPLMILAVPSAFFAIAFGYDLIGFLSSWTRPDMIPGHEHPSMYITLEILSGVVALVTVISAFYIFRQESSIPSLVKGKMKRLHHFLENKWWFDEVFDALIVKPLRVVSDVLFSIVDRILIDGSVNAVAAITEANGFAVGRLHGGKIGLYALAIISFSAFLIIFMAVL